MKKEEIFISYPTYDQYVSREFADKEKVMKDREVASTRCPVCHMPAKRRIRWFMNNSRAYESVALCQKHGYIKGKVRIRHTDEDAYYAIKKLKRIEEKDAEEIREKRDSLRKEETGETSVREAGLKGVWSGNIWQSRLHDRYTYT